MDIVLSWHALVSWLIAHQAAIEAFRSGHQAAALFGFTLLYVALAGLTLPVNVPLSIAAGAVFGFWPALGVTLLGTTLGATLSCLSARVALRGWVRRRLTGRLAQIEAGLEEEGDFYLLSLRLIPLVPYTVVNLVFGLTGMALWRFALLTALGTLPTSVALVNAGTGLQDLENARTLLGSRLVLSLILLSLLPIAASRLRRLWRRPR